MSAIGKVAIPLFSFHRREDITTKWNRVEQKYHLTRKDSGDLAGITIIEMGMSTEDYKALIDSLTRRMAETIGGK